MATAPTKQKPATTEKAINMHKQMAGYNCGGAVVAKKPGKKTGKK